MLKEHPTTVNALLGIPGVRGRILTEKERDGSVSPPLEESALSWGRTRGVIRGPCEPGSGEWYHRIV